MDIDTGNMAYTEELRKLIEEACGREMNTPKDFDFLSGMIFERTHEQVSSFTLKRFWGYIDRGNVSVSTLDILCRYAGFQNWGSYCNRDMEEESGFIVGSQVNVSELVAGKKMIIRWQPDREIIIRYEGMDMFTVLESKNSKLTAETTFHCSVFIAHQPLQLTCVVTKDNSTPQNYICGKKNGISFTLLP